MSDRDGHLTRIGSGHAQTDEILGGGFPAHSINILMGHPGAGKTVLAQQILFHNAGQGRPVLYFTTLSEPLNKVISYLQQFGFYDEERMLGDVVYEDLGPGLVEKGPEYLIERIGQAIREIGPAVLVVDSFKAVHDLSESVLQMRRMTSELAGLLAAYDVTTFLVGEYGDADVPVLPEFAVADGIVQLLRMPSQKRDERFLRVLKLRGSAYHEGLHAFQITENGLVVYPRLVTPSSSPDYEVAGERVASGEPELDAMLDGGLWQGSSTLLVGPTGAGKTTLALGFAIEGVRRGDRVAYLNLQENPPQLARTIRSLGADLDELLASGLHLMYASPVELRIDSVVVELFRLVTDHDINRVVIDSLGDLHIAAGSSDRFHDYLYALTQHFGTRGVTSMLTLEGHADAVAGFTHGARFSSMSDVIIALDILPHEDPPRRTLRVVKARGTPHPLGARQMRIEAAGIRVESAAGG